MKHVGTYNGATAIKLGEPVVEWHTNHLEDGTKLYAKNVDQTDVQDAAEQAYWNFDARRKGNGKYKNVPQSERDAFKAAIGDFLIQLEKGVPDEV